MGADRLHDEDTMKILFTAILMIAIPFSAAAVQYCQEADPANIASIQAATEIHNTRMDVSLTSQEFISLTMKRATFAEMLWQEEQEVIKAIAAQSDMRNELLEQARQKMMARQDELEANW
jgi:hypothetical protein